MEQKMPDILSKGKTWGFLEIFDVYNEDAFFRYIAI